MEFNKTNEQVRNNLIYNANIKQLNYFRGEFVQV